MKRTLKFVTLALLVVVIFASIVPVSAGPVGAIITDVSYDDNTCTMIITWTVPSAGSYYLDIWDNGDLLISLDENYSVAQTIITQVYAGVGQDGDVGIYVGSGGYQSYEIDPYEYNMTGCSTGDWYVISSTNEGVAGCTSALPPETALYTVPAASPTFYAPNLDTQLNFALPAGTWYITEFSGDFAHVFVACGANMVWIPASAVQR